MEPQTDAPHLPQTVADVAEALGLPGRLPEVPTGPTYLMTMANLKVTLDRLCVSVVPDAAVTKGGILVPESARDKPLQGLVVAVGPGKHLDTGYNQPMGMKVGDVVLFVKYGGTKVWIDGAEYLMLRQDETLGVFEQTAPSALPSGVDQE